MTTKKPEFNEINQLQEKALHDKLVAARKLISHGPEQGRSLEGEVAAVIREILPAEYGVGTGFIVYHGDEGPQLSPQLDIIIFDAIRGGPLGQIASCQVYPIEVVYAYIEVKSSLSIPGPNSKVRSNSLQACMDQNNRIREIRKRLYWSVYQFGSPSSFEPVEIVNEFPPLRAFVFAFEAADATAANSDELAERMSNFASKYDAHLHGVLVLDQAFLTTRAVDTTVTKEGDMFHVAYTQEHPLTAFKMWLLRALGTFPRPLENWVPAWEKYFDMPKEWKWKKPS